MRGCLCASFVATWTMALSAAAYPPDVVKAVQSILDNARTGQVAPGTAWQDIRDILLKHNIARTTMVHPDQVMIHPSNRGGLGVNAYNVHSNGAKIKSQGVVSSELEKAVVVEASPAPDTKAAQVAFNTNLINRSKNMLAPLNGSELYLSLGTGHTICFFRAVDARCPTPELSLADKEGRLNPTTMCGDLRWSEAAKSGWKMLVLPWQVEALFPELPNMVQRTLNGVNNVASPQSELECCKSIAEFYEMAEQKNEEAWQRCLEAVGMTEPPCKHYLAKVALTPITSQRRFFYEGFKGFGGEDSRVGCRWPRP